LLIAALRLGAFPHVFPLRAGQFQQPWGRLEAVDRPWTLCGQPGALGTELRHLGLQLRPALLMHADLGTLNGVGGIGYHERVLLEARGPDSP
jgi:hypothetical protein